uniref:Uncharacterized protein n=1 Tax=Zea mays TaxID=4577 RepID=A0A804LNI6_MAIZE
MQPPPRAPHPRPRPRLQRWCAAPFGWALVLGTQVGVWCPSPSPLSGGSNRGGQRGGRRRLSRWRWGRRRLSERSEGDDGWRRGDDDGGALRGEWKGTTQRMEGHGRGGNESATEIPGGSGGEDVGADDGGDESATEIPGGERREAEHHSPTSSAPPFFLTRTSQLQVYNNPQLHRGVLSVDHNLYRDGSTRWMVDQLAKVLAKLSVVNVLTNVQGEIRKVLLMQQV